MTGTRTIKEATRVEKHLAGIHPKTLKDPPCRGRIDIMNFQKHRFLTGSRFSGIQWVVATLAISFAIPFQSADAQRIYRSRLNDKIIAESGPATQVAQKVRANATGILMEVFVRPGESVKKGQLLGHLELAATKYQLDLARQALTNEAATKAAKSHADAWEATRIETEDAVRKRKVEKTRLEWATGMAEYHRKNYEAQLEQKKVQRIQFNYWKEQYDNRFFRAPVDGIVTEVLLDIGKQVNYATHVFSISNEQSYLVPLSLPGDLAAAAAVGTSLPVRVSNGRHVANASVLQVSEDPKAAGRKIITLIVNQNDFPKSSGGNLSGSTFDVLLPNPGSSVSEAGDPRGNHPPTAPAEV